MPDTPDSVRRQANNDSSAGKNAADTQTWQTPLREAYDAEYTRRREEQQRGK